MEERLEQRLRMFHEGGQVRPHVIEFVTRELDALAATGRVVTEDTAGMMTSHLLMALTRLLDGEPLTEFPADEQVAAELADHPEALAEARAVAARAEATLHASLPESEINLLGLHLAALAHNSRA
ncbi:transcriptional antiterminator [Streptomyces sp. NPDC005438]|uniref:transcriptional antiterminator n=1 Tax=Streptomyces sp. NPDC005438 TaxID=3156880 RepID=UPI0033B8C608